VSAVSSERDRDGRIIPYCWEGCGRPATHEIPIGMNGEDEIVALVCANHAGESLFTFDGWPT